MANPAGIRSELSSDDQPGLSGVHENHSTHDAGQGFDVWWICEAAGVVLVVLAMAVYLVAARRAGARDGWPRHRSVLWVLGLFCTGMAWAGPLADAARTDFTAHMAGHLLIGMIGPLLLVLAAPVTLALRTLPPRHARVLAGVLRSPVPRVITHPAVAAALNAGGLWILYATDLYVLMHQSMAVHLLVHSHVFLAGVAFTVAIVGPDPNPHRASFRTRAVVLVLFIAAHSMLGRWLYGHPPTGVDPASARIGAQLMFYGGEVIDLALLILLFSGWYPRAGPRRGLLSRNPSRHHPSPQAHASTAAKV